jgi:hypothetical protein
VSEAAPGRVLRLAVIGWGLGDLALGRRGAAIAWLVVEALTLAVTAVLTVLLVETTWYLVPFLAGSLFVVLWATQAVLAYRRAVSRHGEAPPTPRGSPAATIAWLTIPLLVWGTGFWLVAGSSGSPDAVLDRFVATWPAAGTEGSGLGALSQDPAALETVAAAAIRRLEQMCSEGQLNEDCAQGSESLLRDVRIRLDPRVGERQRAVAEVVEYERVSTRFLGIFAASELRPVPLVPLLELELAAQPAALGSQRWTIVNAEPL